MGPSGPKGPNGLYRPPNGDGKTPWALFMVGGRALKALKCAARTVLQRLDLRPTLAW